jgi:hypothetical protein
LKLFEIDFFVFTVIMTVLFDRKTDLVIGISQGYTYYYLRSIHQTSSKAISETEITV